MSRRTNPLIDALIQAQAFHDRQHTALGRAIDALRAADAPIEDAEPQRPREPGHARPKRQFSAAAKRRMSAGMRRFWKERKATLAAKAARKGAKA